MPERDPRTGRFINGHTNISPGRPSRPTEAKYLEHMTKAVSLDEWEAATKKMLDLAKAGDVAAFKVLVPYFAGLPIQRLQLSTSDADKLSAVLRLIETNGWSASALFDQMLAELAMQKQESEDDDE